MEFDDIVVKEIPGLCRCCLSEGCYKDMGTEYTWMSDNEVYADMLLECFDIGISQHNEGPNGPNRLICEVCITRLRDACNFKKQVVDSEKKFIDMMGRGEFRHKVLIYQSQMKAEVNEEVEDTEVEYLEDMGEYVDEDDLPLKSEVQEPSVSEVAAEPLPTKRGRPRKNAEKPEKKRKVEERPKSSKAVVKGRKGGKKGRIRDEGRQPRRVKYKDDENDKHDEDVDERTQIMRNNVVQVINNSTIMPFRWLKSSYRCFYCYEVFQEPRDLKTHQAAHVNESKLKCMENYWETTVHVDVSSLSCKLCPKVITEFYDLIDHLITAHEVPFNKDIGICMNPFKLNNISVQCALCSREYRTFGHLLLHMNEEHKGYSQLLCDVCGRHCRNKSHLREHKKEHVNRSVTCTVCGETLSSYHKLRPHMQNMHDKKYKCKVCPEQFETHYKRSLHMMTVHKSREEVKCQYCQKTFVFRSTMMAHLRVTHLQEKNTVCGICGWKTVGNSKLKRHMSKHSNEKNYKCTVCEKAFKTKKNMLLHQRNVHEKEVQMPHAFPASGLG